MNFLAITHLINGILMVLIGIGGGILLIRKFHTGWRLWWIGAATFIISQIGHIPFNALVGLLIRREVIPTPPEGFSLAFSAIFLGLSAGIWEEGARYASYRWWAIDARSWPKGLVLGAGHGGIEAIILGILVLYTYIQMIALREADLTQIISPNLIEIARQQINIYWSLPWYASLLGAIERLFAIIAQLALSIVVLQVFLRKQIYWLVVAVFWHATIDSMAVFVANTHGAYWVEFCLAIITLVNIAIIFLLREKQIPTDGVIPIDLPSDKRIFAPMQEVAETQENLERTRYN